MKRKRGTYDGSAKRARGPPIPVPEKLLSADPEHLRRFLETLMRAVLDRRILARQASCVRGIIETSLRMTEVELLEKLERQVQELESVQARNPSPMVKIERIPLREQMRRGGEEMEKAAERNTGVSA